MKLVSPSKGDAPDPAPSEREINLSLGRRIRHRGKLLGMTQGDLAAALGLQFQQVQKFECSSSRISASRPHVLAAVLKAPISYFLSGLSNDIDVGSNKSGHAATSAAELLSEKETRELLGAYVRLPERVGDELGSCQGISAVT